MCALANYTRALPFALDDILGGISSSRDAYNYLAVNTSPYLHTAIIVPSSRFLLSTASLRPRPIASSSKRAAVAKATEPITPEIPAKGRKQSLPKHTLFFF